MITQLSQNKYHTHNAKHAHTASTSVDIMTHHGGKNGRYNYKPYMDADGDYSGNDWSSSYWGISTSCSTTVNENNFNVAYNGNSNIPESNPNNYTYKLWKRIN